MSYETKINKVLKYLISNGSITSWEAIEFGCTRLSAVIWVLKNRGYKFNTIYLPLSSLPANVRSNKDINIVKNQYKYAKYFLIEKPKQLTLNL